MDDLYKKKLLRIC